MSKIGLFYGTETGNTREAAEFIQQAFNEIEQDMVEVFDVAGTKIGTMQNYDALVLGVSTWDDGELQYDWADVVDDLDEMDLSGKKVAIFGLGDQYGYADTFQNAIGILSEKIRERGAKLVGFTSIEGYDFDESRGVENDRFMGLALDEENQNDLTAQRINDWVKQLQKELNL